MKELETIKEYSKRLLSIANRVRLLGFEFNDSHIIEKNLVIVLKRFDATITTLENTKDLSKITLVELLNSLQAQEQRRVLREVGFVEEALQAKHEGVRKSKKRPNKKYQQGTSSNNNKSTNFKGKYPPYKHCNKVSHSPSRCWKWLDAKCTKCNQFGHEAVI